MKSKLNSSQSTKSLQLGHSQSPTHHYAKILKNIQASQQSLNNISQNLGQKTNNSIEEKAAGKNQKLSLNITKVAKTNCIKSQYSSQQGKPIFQNNKLTLLKNRSSHNLAVSKNPLSNGVQDKFSAKGSENNKCARQLNFTNINQHSKSLLTPNSQKKIFEKNKSSFQQPSSNAACNDENFNQSNISGKQQLKQVLNVIDQNMQNEQNYNLTNQSSTYCLYTPKRKNEDQCLTERLDYQNKENIQEQNRQQLTENSKQQHQYFVNNNKNNSQQNIQQKFPSQATPLPNHYNSNSPNIYSKDSNSEQPNTLEQYQFQGNMNTQRYLNQQQQHHPQQQQNQLNQNSGMIVRKMNDQKNSKSGKELKQESTQIQNNNMENQSNDIKTELVSKFHLEEQEKKNQTEQDQKIEIISSVQDEGRKNEKPILKCQNCRVKKGKYKVHLQNQSFYYCSKCSIALAQQGIKVIDMKSEEQSMTKDLENINIITDRTTDSSQQNNQNTSRDKYTSHDSSQDFKQLLQQESQQSQFSLTQSQLHRKKQLENFNERVMSNLAQCSQHKSAIISRHQDLNSFYEKQEMKVEKISQQLIDMIQMENTNIMQKFKFMKGMTGDLYQKHQNQLDEIHMELSNTYKDIAQNMYKILTGMEDGPFQMILNQYEEKLFHYSQFLQKQNQDELNLCKLQFNSKDSLTEQVRNSVFPQLKMVFSIKQQQTSLLRKNSAEDESLTSSPHFKIAQNESQFSEDYLEFVGKNNIYKEGNSIDSQRIAVQPSKFSPLKHQSNKNQNSNSSGSIYVSFDNKEIFENVLQQSQQQQNHNNSHHPTTQSKPLYIIHQNQQDEEEEEECQEQSEDHYSPEVKQINLQEEVQKQQQKQREVNLILEDKDQENLQLKDFSVQQIQLQKQQQQQQQSSQEEKQGSKHQQIQFEDSGDDEINENEYKMYQGPSNYLQEQNNNCQLQQYLYDPTMRQLTTEDNLVIIEENDSQFNLNSNNESDSNSPTDNQIQNINKDETKQSFVKQKQSFTQQNTQQLKELEEVKQKQQRSLTIEVKKNENKVSQQPCNYNEKQKKIQTNQQQQIITTTTNNNNYEDDSPQLPPKNEKKLNVNQAKQQSREQGFEKSKASIHENCKDSISVPKSGDFTRSSQGSKLRNSQKYHELLEKVNINQNVTHQFYNNVIKGSTCNLPLPAQDNDKKSNQKEKISCSKEGLLSKFENNSNKQKCNLQLTGRSQSQNKPPQPQTMVGNSSKIAKSIEGAICQKDPGSSQIEGRFRSSSVLTPNQQSNQFSKQQQQQKRQFRNESLSRDKQSIEKYFQNQEDIQFMPNERYVHAYIEEFKFKKQESQDGIHSKTISLSYQENEKNQIIDFLQEQLENESSVKRGSQFQSSTFSCQSFQQPM